jgi:hypothetical protein
MKTKNVLQLLFALFLSACGSITVVVPTGSPPTVVETFTPVIDYPDLLISSVSLTMQGQMGGNCVSNYGPYEVHIVIQNLGTGPAYNISVVETSTGTNLTVGELAPFAIFELNFPASSPTGSYTFTVDAQNLIAESDESNNVFSFLQPTPTPPVICTPTPAPMDGTPIASFTPYPGNEPTPQATSLVVWQRAGSTCQTISYWSDRMGIGPCSPSLDPVKVAYPILEDYFSRYAIWTKAYAPFIAQTKLGMVTFNGSGYVIATSAEQRMIAEWAARMLNELPEGNSSSGGSHVLSKQFSNETSCFSMAIHPDGKYQVESCTPSFAYSTPTGYLDANELIYLYRWYDGLYVFQERDANGTLSFIGNGTVDATLADKISIDAMAMNVEAKARGSVSGGGFPSAALAAQGLLSKQLGISWDQVQVRNVESLDYPDTCLGAPGPGEVCTTMPTPGYRIQLVAQGLLYEFHTDSGGYELRQYGEPIQAPPVPS